MTPHVNTTEVIDVENKNTFKKLEYLDQKIKEIHDEKTSVMDQICRDRHPVSIGDEVVVNYKYSHEGKTIVVDRIGITRVNHPSAYAFTASGLVKKKNGDLGVHRGHWREI